jgi:hypothetical protein
VAGFPSGQSRLMMNPVLAPGALFLRHFGAFAPS